MTETTQRPHERIWPQRLPRQLAVPATSLWFNLDVTAKRYPDKAATIFFGREMSYGELHASADSVAGWLQSVGVKAGDRVALCMQNCPQFLASFFGILPRSEALQRCGCMHTHRTPMHQTCGIQRGHGSPEVVGLGPCSTSPAWWACRPACLAVLP